MDDLLLFLEFPIDFKGQQLAQEYTDFALKIISVLSVLVGFITQRIEHVVYVFGAGLAVIFLVVLPSWSRYNQNPVSWVQLSFFADEKEENSEDGEL